MVIYTTRHIFLASFLGAILTVIVSGLSENKQKQEQATAVVSKCDSLQIEINVLKYEVEVMDNRITKYKVGLEFLKDKDPRAYRYVMNAGNLEFNDRL